MARFMRSCSTSITSIGNDDSSLTTVDFTGDSIFQMKSDAKTQDLCTALRNNHFVKTLKLKNCEIGDGCGVMLGEMLSSNTTIEMLDLSENKPLKEAGAIALAEGLTNNTTLREMDLMGLLGSAVKSEKVLRAFIDMFQINLTLKKIKWRLDHPLANTLARLITRNNSIDRSIKQEKPFENLLPDNLKGTGVVVLGYSAATGKPATAAETSAAAAPATAA
eukprot:CAMPEP_0119482480 /NCGR_PEP_ID=MMETSP1344-20130328/10314_1 /TAXON_ID=236787 /ORGANISM="Florenciella parvula, Strain CCMP2471" /LENGTH=219 /DNA_ID=CAMNT_0007516877 /DNA_START=87 /DNA_END=743 /DNA_ORIENTATION=-